MTLVLGAFTSDAVVLGADSRVWHETTADSADGNIVTSTSATDRKLFKLATAGIATYGTATEHVPTAIDKGLDSNWDIPQAIRFMQERFNNAEQMFALVGGWERGAPVMYEVGMSGGNPRAIIPEFGRPPQIALRGLRHSPVDQRPPGTVASVIEQMLEILAESAGPHVGPSYEILVIPRPIL